MNKRKYEFAQELNRQMKKKGFSKVSISDICESMRCSRQSFYYYFNTLHDCLAYFVRDSLKTQIREDYLISDVFNYFDNNASFIALCNSDDESRAILWDCIYDFTKKILDLIFSRNIMEYLTLYTEQKDALISFYIAGLLEVVRMYVQNNYLPSKEKCIDYCKAIFGSAETTKEAILRFNR